MTSTFNKSEMDELLEHIHDLVQEGFKKKHFEFTVCFASQSKAKTCVRITGGPSTQFVLRQNEVRE